jgi:hypothetical protein
MPTEFLSVQRIHAARESLQHAVSVALLDTHEFLVEHNLEQPKPVTDAYWQRAMKALDQHVWPVLLRIQRDVSGVDTISETLMDVVKTALEVAFKSVLFRQSVSEFIHLRKGKGY